MDPGIGDADGHSSNRNGVPLAGMKPVGTYARSSNIASKMPVNMSYRLRLSAAGLMIASLRCQTLFPGTSGKTTKCDRNPPAGKDIPQRIATLVRASPGYERQRP